MNKLNPSIKHHLYNGTLISLWVFVFVFFIRPFDDGTIISQWPQISAIFSLVVLVCYSLIAILQTAIYQKRSKWSISSELMVLFLFYSLFTPISYLFYKSPILYGGYNYLEFSTKIILKSSFILTPILVLTRYFLTKLVPDKNDTIIIKGESKLDILKIRESDLVCVKSSQNYVELFFLLNGQLSSRVIRSSLKKIQNDVDFLIQVHRSHLMNPSHFKFLKNQNTISLTQIDIPLSKSYRKNILL